AGTYFLGVHSPTGGLSNITYSLSTELTWLTPLTWDPGATHLGTEVYTNFSSSGGDYYFKITTQNSAYGVWRTALNVLSGEADLYLSTSIPSRTSFYYASTNAGSDGVCLAQGSQFYAGQDWYILVHASAGAQWNLVSGDVYVLGLPPLATN